VLCRNGDAGKNPLEDAADAGSHSGVGLWFAPQSEDDPPITPGRYGPGETTGAAVAPPPGGPHGGLPSFRPTPGGPPTASPPSPSPKFTEEDPGTVAPPQPAVVTGRRTGTTSSSSARSAADPRTPLGLGERREGDADPDPEPPSPEGVGLAIGAIGRVIGPGSMERRLFGAREGAEVDVAPPRPIFGGGPIGETGGIGGAGMPRCEYVLFPLSYAAIFGALPNPLGRLVGSGCCCCCCRDADPGGYP